MNGQALRTKELWAGLLYLAFGSVGFWMARRYGFGTTTQMGAGYFPTVLSGGLILVGMISVIKASYKVADYPDSHLGDLAPKVALLILSSVVVFGLLLPVAGFAIALPAMLVVSAAASSRFRLQIKPLLAMTAFCLFCYLVFIKGLNVPLRPFGTWFGR